MSGHLMETAHMRMTPRRDGTPSDTARANEILAELRREIAGYTDYRAAVADGYRQFLPGIPQKVYHFTNYGRAARQALSFDAAKPTSLLYESLPDGGYKLVGAMYTAPARASAEKLDARVPLSIAQWHLHTNLCFPPRNAPQRFSETRNGRPLFGPKGSVASKSECDAAGGRFFERLFGWMLHVNPYEKDAASVWGSNTSEMKH
ncbi:MAG: hypothetical protein ABR543_17580 [Gemmatimonadaceae bacterium]